MMLDGELGLEERRELESTLQNDLQARSMHETLREGGRHGREVFAELLKEPVPLDLVRSIKTASSPRKAVRLPGDQVGLFSGKPTVSQAALAILLAVALGGGIGYMLGQQPSITRQAVTTDDVDWLSDVVT
ncbi:MAG TPA: anti-sigma factor, partial [Pseudorhizobium sp.]|nr:anti-sigma factor [Pseudorhizobium sp.]